MNKGKIRNEMKKTTGYYCKPCKYGFTATTPDENLRAICPSCGGKCNSVISDLKKELDAIQALTEDDTERDRNHHE